LINYQESGFLMGAGSPAGKDTVESMSPLGIVQGHAYSLLRIVDIDGLKLMQLRNPWGKYEWKGDYSDNSLLWTRRLMSKLGFVKAEDGSFWMKWEDFIQNFDEIYVCKFFDKPWIAQPIIYSRWSTMEKTAGGCTNYDSVGENPLYLLTIKEPETTVVINLAQQDIRGTDLNWVAIGIEVYAFPADKSIKFSAKTLGNFKMVAFNPGGYIFRREVTLQYKPNPKAYPSTYVVLMSTFDPNQERDYVCRVFSSKNIGWEAAPR